MISVFGNSLLLLNIGILVIAIFSLTFSSFYTTLVKLYIKYTKLQFCSINNKTISNFVYSCIGISYLVTSAALILLLYAFINNIFSLDIVLSNSSTIMPLIYRITAVWANYEGSLLLFLWQISLVTLIFVKKLSNNKSTNFETSLSNSNILIRDIWLKIWPYHIMKHRNAIVLQCFILMVLNIFIVLVANPFTSNVYNMTEGMGLNPLLQDVGLMIHPPILYFGYSITTILFSVSVNSFKYKVFFWDQKKKEVFCNLSTKIHTSTSAEYDNFLKNTDNSHDTVWCILNNQLEKHGNFFDPKTVNTLLIDILNFSRFSWFFLTCGLALGSWWAYRELGWGGYWFFDPVENFALINWISITAFHHSLVTTLKNRTKVLWTYLLGILTFILTVFTISVIRSGILLSVHSFAFDLDRGIILFFLTLITTLYSFINYRKFVYDFLENTKHETKKIYENNESNLKCKNNLFSFIAYDNAITLANILWLTTIAILLLSIIFPIAYYILYNQQFSIESEFFYNNIIPITAPILLVMCFINYDKFKFSISYNSTHRCFLVLCAVLSILIWFYYVYFHINIPLNNKFSWSRFAVIFITQFLSVCLILKMIYQICKMIYMNNKNVVCNLHSMLISHLSFGVLVFGISTNVLLQDEKTFEITMNDSIQFGRFNLSLQDIKLSFGPNYLIQSPRFLIHDHSNVIELTPELRFYVIEDTVTSDADIYSFLFYDLYCVISNIEYSSHNISDSSQVLNFSDKINKSFWKYNSDITKLLYNNSSDVSQSLYNSSGNIMQKNNIVDTNNFAISSYISNSGGIENMSENDSVTPPGNAVLPPGNAVTPFRNVVTSRRNDVVTPPLISSRFSKSNAVVTATVYYRPSMFLIWISSFGIMLGIIIPFINKNRKNKV